MLLRPAGGFGGLVRGVRGVGVDVLVVDQAVGRRRSRDKTNATGQPSTGRTVAKRRQERFQSNDLLRREMACAGAAEVRLMAG